jgi:hypothetical protein
MARESTWGTVEDVSKRLAEPATRMTPETIRMPDGEMSAPADVLNVIGAVLAGTLAGDQVIMTIVQLEDFRADEQRLAKGEWVLLTSTDLIRLRVTPTEIVPWAEGVTIPVTVDQERIARARVQRVKVSTEHLCNAPGEFVARRAHVQVEVDSVTWLDHSAKATEARFGGLLRIAKELSGGGEGAGGAPAVAGAGGTAAGVGSGHPELP